MNVKIKISNRLCESYQTFNKRDYFYTLEIAQSPGIWVWGESLFVPFLLLQLVAFAILPCFFKLWCKNYTQTHHSFSGQSTVKNTEMLQTMKASVPQALALSPRHIAAVATPPASHAWAGPRIGVEQLRKIKVPWQTETESLGLPLPWQRGGYYLQSPLLSGPGAS